MTHQLANARLGRTCGFTALLMIWCVGCAIRYPEGGIPVKLTYEISERDKAPTDLQGVAVSIVRFGDDRTTLKVYDHKGILLVLDDDMDAGDWMTRALQCELEHAGARVEIISCDTRPTSGCVITGVVTRLRSEPTGVNLGSVVALATETGYKAYIRVRLQVITPSDK